MKLFLTAAALMLSIAAPARAQLAPPNAAGLTYGHVHLNVKDIELHKKLWADHFGGVVVQKGPLTAIKLPNMLIALTQREPTGPSQGTVMDHFGFKVRNITEIKDGWRAAGYEVQSEFTGAEGFPNAYLLGPDGLRIELQEDQTLAVKAAPNHIHFWTADYVTLLDWYIDTLGVVRRKRGTIETTADAPGLNLSFQTARTPTVPTKGRVIDHIGFEVKNLEAFCKALEAKGVKFRCTLSRRAEYRAEDRLLHRSIGGLYRAHRGLRQVLIIDVFVAFQRGHPADAAAGLPAARSRDLFSPALVQARRPVLIYWGARPHSYVQSQCYVYGRALVHRRPAVRS